jgi:murein DD-endopeptidase MepM/ murein hydrolase activator NlpD
MPLIRCRTVHCGRAPAVPASRVYPIPKRFASRVVRSPGPYGVHPTEGLPGYPAIDFAAEAPASVVAVESGRVRDWSGHSPGLGPVGGIHGPFGWSIYLRGDSGRDYYYTHLGSRAVAPGVRVRVGQRIGRVGDYSRWGGLDHLHLGGNVGRTRSNSGADYARGAALIVAISRAPRP